MMDADVAVARQLVDAYADALDEADAEGQEYAAEQLAEFVDEADDTTTDEILVALLDLPLEPGTLAILNEVSAKLGRRGPGVVEALLEAALGDAPPELSLRDVVSVAGAVGALLEAATRGPSVPPRTENALSVLEAMPEGDTVLGLIEVLEGPKTRLKKAASELLVEIGDTAVERLQMSLNDRDAEPWVTDTLVDIRERRDPGGYASGEAELEATSADEALDEASDDSGPNDDGYAADEPADEPGDDDTVDEPGDDDTVDEPGDDNQYEADAEADRPPADAPGVADPADTSGGLPSASAIDRDYDDFVARFKRETGQR
jgi:hypothetical protein